MALHQADGGKAKLYACLNEMLEEDGEVYMSGYSHMVYEDAEKNHWDIGGCDASARWELLFFPEDFDEDEPDEDGLFQSLKWVEVPTGSNYMETNEWLKQHSVETTDADLALREALVEVFLHDKQRRLSAFVSKHEESHSILMKRPMSMDFGG